MGLDALVTSHQRLGDSSAGELREIARKIHGIIR